MTELTRSAATVAGLGLAGMATAIVATGGALAHPGDRSGHVGGYGPHMADGWMAGGGAGWGLWAWFLPLLALLVLVAVLGYLFVRDGTPGRTDRALEELRAAYARGEIDDEEFEHRRARLAE